MPRAPLLTGRKWKLQVSRHTLSISLFPHCRLLRSTVLLFICVQTSYHWCSLCIGGRRGSRNHTRFDSLLLVFRTSPLPLGLVSHKSQIVGLNYLSIAGDSTSLSIFDYLSLNFRTRRSPIWRLQRPHG